VGDAAYINLEIEALHRRTREMPAQTSLDGSAADELVGKERMDVEDRINLLIRAVGYYCTETAGRPPDQRKTSRRARRRERKMQRFKSARSAFSAAYSF
jgi:hypothetical protein